MLLSCERVKGVLQAVRIHRGHPVAVTHMVDLITRQLVGSIERFAQDHKILLLFWEQSQRNDESANNDAGGSTNGKGSCSS
jgi:hypothetical protein